MSSLSVNHLLGIKYLNLNDLKLIFETSDHFKEVINRKIKKVPSLRDVTIANLFFENSTRTQTTFEIAAKRLSADVINLDIATSSQSKGESILDLINNLIAMGVSIFVVRHSKPGIPAKIAQNIKNMAHVINAGDGNKEHPTQALLDAYTIRSFKKKFDDLKVAIVGDIEHSRVAKSEIYILNKLGVTSFTLLSVHCALNNTETNNS